MCENSCPRAAAADVDAGVISVFLHKVTGGLSISRSWKAFLDDEDQHIDWLVSDIT